MPISTGTTLGRYEIRSLLGGLAADGKQMVPARGNVSNDVVLISDAPR